MWQPKTYRRWEFQLNPGGPRTYAAGRNHSVTTGRLGLQRWLYAAPRSGISFHAAVAEKWQAGRVFLAGDAAHQTPPFLGQGINSGMRDVINLAWKLPLVLNGRCLPNLLETYKPSETHMPMI